MIVTPTVPALRNLPTDREQVYYVKPPKMRFDPSQKLLVETAATVKIRRGEGESQLSIGAFRSVTAAPANISQMDELIARGTFVPRDVAQWGRLPTIASYLSLEELDDAEATELAVLSATKKLGW